MYVCEISGGTRESVNKANKLDQELRRVFEDKQAQFSVQKQARKLSRLS